MNFIFHDVNREEKLLDFAKEIKMSVEEIKMLNPELRIFKTFLGIEYIAAQQTIKIPSPDITKTSESNSKYTPLARYRCKQTNVTKALDQTTFVAHISTQYLVAQSPDRKNVFKFQLEDYIPQIHPEGLQASFDLVTPIEYIRNHAQLEISEDGGIHSVLNLLQLNQQWHTFKENQLPKIQFFQQLQSANPVASQDFVQKANKEFSDETTCIRLFDKNLFFHIFLRSLVGIHLKDFQITEFSQLFPHFPLTTKVQKTIVSENSETTTLRLVGVLELSPADYEKVKALYDEIYLPILKFSFSSFDQIYRITYTIDTKTGILLDARATLSERIKNNFETTTQFELQRIEL